VLFQVKITKDEIVIVTVPSYLAKFEELISRTDKRWYIIVVALDKQQSCVLILMNWHRCTNYSLWHICIECKPIMSCGELLQRLPVIWVKPWGSYSWIIPVPLQGRENESLDGENAPVWSRQGLLKGDLGACGDGNVALKTNDTDTKFPIKTV